MGNKAGKAGIRHERGATLVEFAVVAPLLFLLLFGILELGRAVVTYTAVTTAAREAARFGTTVGQTENGIPRYSDCEAIRDAGKAKTPLINLEDDAFDITYSGGNCNGDVASYAIGHGDWIEVTAESEFRSPIPVLGNLIGDLDISSTQRRTVYPGDSS